MNISFIAGGIGKTSYDTRRYSCHPSKPLLESQMVYQRICQVQETSQSQNVAKLLLLLLFLKIYLAQYKKGRNEKTLRINKARKEKKSVLK